MMSIFYPCLHSLQFDSDLCNKHFLLLFETIIALGARMLIVVSGLRKPLTDTGADILDKIE